MPATVAPPKPGYQPSMFDMSKGGWGQTIKSPYGPGQSGIPAPDYTIGYNPYTQSTAQPLQQQLDGINLNTQGLEKFRGEALRTGPSEWSKLATGQQNQEELNAREKATRDSRGASAGAMSDLAMRGGLTSGARERVAKSGSRNLMDMQQDVARQGSQNRLQIGVNDEQNRIQQLGMLPGMENQALEPGLQKAQMSTQANQFDVSQGQQEATNRNIFTSNAYNQQMKAWAANQTANATANSGGSCWLISRLAKEVKLPMDEAHLLTRFKMHMLNVDLKGAKFYIRRCGKLIEKMDAKKFDWPSFRWFNDALVNLMRAGEHDAAYTLFRSTLTGLLMEYWTDCPFEPYLREVQRRAEVISRAETVKKPDLPDREQNLAEKCLQNLTPEQFQPA